MFSSVLKQQQHKVSVLQNTRGLETQVRRVAGCHIITSNNVPVYRRYQIPSTFKMLEIVVYTEARSLG
jgi:hypothetical protein